MLNFSARSLLACAAFALLALPAAPTHAQDADDPTAPGSLFEVVQQTDSLATFVSTLRAAGLTDLLEEDGPFTVFAPTEAAFAALPESTFAPLLRPENRSSLRALLTYHVVEGRLMVADLRSRTTLKTLQGGQIGVDSTRTPITLRDGTEATVTTTNLPASNGVLHVIDTVLLPPQKTAAMDRQGATERR
jgi:uncharacterized surface protein with fasciclin (FAS1) repeats